MRLDLSIYIILYGYMYTCILDIRLCMLVNKFIRYEILDNQPMTSI